MSDWTCPECVTDGRRGYCAPQRCYCAHETCHAFASWSPRAEPFANVEPIQPTAESG